MYFIATHSKINRYGPCSKCIKKAMGWRT